MWGGAKAPPLSVGNGQGPLNSVTVLRQPGLENKFLTLVPPDPSSGSTHPVGMSKGCRLGLSPEETAGFGPVGVELVARVAASRPTVAILV